MRSSIWVSICKICSCRSPSSSMCNLLYLTRSTGSSCKYRRRCRPRPRLSPAPRGLGWSIGFLRLTAPAHAPNAPPRERRDLPYNALSTARRQPGIFMHVHPVLPWNLKLQQPQLPRSEPGGQPTESSQLANLSFREIEKFATIHASRGSSGDPGSREEESFNV